ncbi:uncharacterized protein FIBRA_04576 [Fibroporia radiculosa]|uniref:mRNA-capping enzyme subunit beta n=1 Tax=Fibroporia radiculosa TaxID=599839 RepID=J4IA86_9APHY|nr:uncharacterized protein FIBRA_04576 [Fibroporia radiculosa]CCM02476.1 predicted protein [Fibroporia radiculosa]
MDTRDYSPDDTEHDTRRPLKRARRTPPPSEPYTSTSTNSTHMSNGNRNGSTHTPPLPLLSLSILGVEPLDEFILEVADFVHETIRTWEGAGKVELEAKIGVLRDKTTGQRLQLPSRVETILPAKSVLDYRFESNMSPKQHQYFNGRLNQLKLNPPIPQSPISYAHLHLIDSFYNPDGSRDRVRVTRDENTGTVVACMRKVRLGDLDIYCPKRVADWRISVNVEIPVPQPIGTATHTRKKDRLSYSHEEFVIDLTQVTSSTGTSSQPEVLHELEIEVARSDYLVYVASKRNDPSAPEEVRGAFDELIRAFVNNARILVRNADPRQPL